MFIRRLIILCLAAAHLAPFAAGAAPVVAAKAAVPPREGVAAPCPAALTSFVGLSRNYDLSFLWFDRLADGHLSFAPDLLPGRYRAILEAKTRGVAASLTGDRVQRYETLMEWSPQGRLVPIEHTSNIVKNKQGKKIAQAKLYTFDKSGKIEMFRIKDGKRSAGRILPIRSNCLPVDFLTAFFNFVIGVDGPLGEGERRELSTIGQRGEEKISVEILKLEQWPKLSIFKNRSGILLKVVLPPEVLDTGGGSVYALLSHDGRPERVIIENVLGIGDVRGMLRE